MRPPNPVKTYQQQGLFAALTPPGAPTHKTIQEQGLKKTLNPRLAIQRTRDSV